MNINSITLDMDIPMRFTSYDFVIDSVSNSLFADNLLPIEPEMQSEVG